MGCPMLLHTQLTNLGVESSTAILFAERRKHSEMRIEELTRRLSQQEPVRKFPGLAIFAAGSYARGEASEYSDIDLFFIRDDRAFPIVEDPRLKGIRVMSAVIREIEDGMEFPPPSNDGEFLNIISLSEVLKHLGGSEDDHRNHFTARMLLLLESVSVFGEDSLESSVGAIVEAYLRDYENHVGDFRATFLMNDIMRFWKTLCLNYEHRRNQQEEAKKVKQKIKNFKLKYSRLLTCFATVNLLSSYRAADKSEIVQICKMRPLDRVIALAERIPEVKRDVVKVLELYSWFLQKTALPPDELEAFFAVKQNRVEAFSRANSFGDGVYSMLMTSSQTTGALRYLVM